MFKKLIKSLATFTFLLALTASTFASGKMEVPLGGKVTLQAQATQTGGSYKWVAKKGRDIIATQTGALFDYTFDVQGEYQVNLTVTDRAGATRSSVVDVLVGNRYSAPSGTGSSVDVSTIDTPLKVETETLPATTSEKTVHIAGDEGRVVFDIASRPDVLEYRIDRNVFIDSDGNGIANDDIDNADHSSYLLGGIWQTKYKASESNEIAAEITVVNTQGQKAKTQVQIIFGSTPAKEGKVVAILDTLPVFDQTDKKIYVYGEKDSVAFYPRRSQGDIVEYRIDKNIFVDSDGDGNPSNDIDNRTDTSFKNGDVWVADYEKTDQQIIAQLIVVGSGGTGSRIQREIEFTEAPEPVIEEAPQDSVIQLVADKEFVQKGDPVVFSVEGLSLTLDNYIFDWDFNGDEEVDQTVEGDNTVSYIYDTAAIQPVKVKVMDLDGNEADFTLDFLVKDIAATKADFEFVVDGLKVDFTNLSEVSQTLTDRTLDYTWSFGDDDVDNYDEQRDKIGSENPTYNYVKPGTYVVTLTVVDGESVTDTKSVEIEIAAPEGYVEDAPVVDGQEASKEKKEGSVFGKIIKVILYIILIVLVLFLLVVLGLLVFLKVQHPDLVFEELIDELKIKILGMMGVHDMIEPGAPAATEAAPAQPAAEPAPEVETPAAPTPAQEVEAAAKAATAPQEDLSKSDAPMPDWLKPKTEAPAEPAAPAPEVIEGEVVEETTAPAPTPAPETPAPAPEVPTPPTPEAPPAPDTPAADDKPAEGGDLNQTDGPVPDWLKQ